MGKSNKRPFVFILFLVVIVIGFFVVYQAGLLSPNDQVIYIAVMRAQTGSDAVDGLDTLRGIELYLDEIDYRVAGKRIEILDFDDMSITGEAVKRAEEMVSGSKQPLLVIGHAQSASSTSAGEIYKENRIPAITGSATDDSITQDNEWYFRVIPASRSQSVFLANYMYHIMDHKTATVIHDQDSFGSSLAQPFQEEFTRLGGKINFVLSYERNDQIDQTLDSIIDTLISSEKEEVGAIFLAARAQQGAKLIYEMRKSNFDVPLYGPSSFANLNFITSFQEFPEERSSPGFYSDGVYTIAPIIFDVAGIVGQDFRNAFLDQYHEEPGMKAATNYDAIKVAVDAIEKANISGNQEDIAQDRQKIRDYLAAINQPTEAIEGVTGEIYFDEVGNVVKPVSIGLYKQQQLISALTQLQPIPDISRIADFDEILKAGRILEIDGQYMYKTDVVYTGIDFIEISNLDEKTSTYAMDFYLWFRYQGDVDADNIVFINTMGDVSLGEPIAAHVIDGTSYKAYRVKADFSSDFSFQAYPFDQQKLAVIFRHANRTRERLIYVVDFLGMGISSGSNAMDKLQDVRGDNQILNIGSWSPKKIDFFQNITVNQSTLGNPNFFGSNSDIEYSRFNGIIQIQRNVLSFGLKNLLPLFAVTILAYLSVLLPADQFVVKNAIDRGALLTVAFFHIKLSNDLPGIGYTVALDYVFYAFYALIVMNLIISVIIRSEHLKENHTLTHRLGIFGKIAYPAVIVLVVILFIVRYGSVNWPPF